MKEAIGSYWLTGIVITFIVLFTGYMCLSINMNKAYKVKNEIINIIQKNNGLDENALEQIQDYMTKVGYRTEGNCNPSGLDIEDSGFEGFSITGTSHNKDNGIFCAKQYYTDYPATNVEEHKRFLKVQFPDVAYYQIKVFFSVDLPIVRHFFTFEVKGSTKKLFYPCEKTKCLLPK